MGAEFQAGIGNQVEVDAQVVHIGHAGGDELHFDLHLARGDIQNLDDLLDLVEAVGRGFHQQRVVALQREDSRHAFGQLSGCGARPARPQAGRDCRGCPPERDCPRLAGRDSHRRPAGRGSRRRRG